MVAVLTCAEQYGHEKTISKAVQQEIDAFVKRNKDEPEQRLAEVAAIANVTLFAHFLTSHLNETPVPTPSYPANVHFNFHSQYALLHASLDLIPKRKYLELQLMINIIICLVVMLRIACGVVVDYDDEQGDLMMMKIMMTMMMMMMMMMIALAAIDSVHSQLSFPSYLPLLPL